MTIKKRHDLYLFLILFISFISCNKSSLKVDAPAYLIVDSMNVSTTPSFQGTSSSKISDVWVYIDGNQEGVFELPAKIPIINDGVKDVILYPGIKKDGGAYSRVVYPFYEPFNSNLNFNKGGTDTITPVLTYQSGTNFWLETFEDPSIKFGKVDTSMTGLVRINDNEGAFAGNYSGKLEFLKDENINEIITSQKFDFPNQGLPVFIELNYTNTTNLRVFIEIDNNGNKATYDIVYLYPKAYWNKIYLDLTYITSFNANASFFEIGFGISNDKSREDDYAILDEIKLLRK